MSPADILERSAARWLLLVLPLGVLLRSAFVWMYSPGPLVWGNLIHAHSHTAYFGWAGLGLMSVILRVLPGLTGRPLEHGKALKVLLWLAPWAVGGALVAFALQGYAAFSIAFSTLNEVVWFLFAYVFWQNVKQRPIREWPPVLWLIGTAVALLLVSTLGTVLVIIATVILKTGDPVLGNAGVYLFLQAYGDGWLEVGILGVAAAMLGGLPDRTNVKWQSLLSLLCMAPAALRLLVPFGLSGVPAEVGALAGVGLCAAQVLYLFAIPRAPGRIPAHVKPWWYLAGLALAVKIPLELLPFLPGWGVWAGNRQLVIAFLHLKLLGLVTAGLIGAIGFRRRIGASFWIFAPGAAAMVVTLAAYGFFAGTVSSLSHQLFAVAFWTALVAAIGAAVAVWPFAFGRAD